MRTDRSCTRSVLSLSACFLRRFRDGATQFDSAGILLSRVDSYGRPAVNEYCGGGCTPLPKEVPVMYSRHHPLLFRGSCVEFVDCITSHLRFCCQEVVVAIERSMRRNDPDYLRAGFTGRPCLPG